MIWKFILCFLLGLTIAPAFWAFVYDLYLEWRNARRNDAALQAEYVTKKDPHK